MRRFLGRLLRYIKDYRLRMLLVALGMIMVAVSSAAVAYLVKPVLDDIFVERDRQMLMVIPLLVVLAYAVRGSGRYIQSVNTAYIGEDLVRRLRDRLLESLRGLDLLYFNRERSGRLVSRITNDFTRIRLTVSNHLAVLVREALVILAYLGVALYNSPRLSVYGLAALPVAAYPIFRLARRLKSLSHRSQEKDSLVTSHLVEMFNNMEIIKAHSGERRELAIFQRRNREFFRINIKGVKARELAGPLIEFIGAVAFALVIVIGGLEVIEGRLTIGTFFSFSAALLLLNTPVKRIATVYNQLQDAVAASERIFDLLAERPAITSGKRLLDRPIEEIAFHDVGLSYDGNPALREVNLELRRGEPVALVGGSGGGKTSLVNLALRLVDPDQGEVLINGTDCRQLDLKALRSRIGIVTQRLFVFNDSVAANVAYGSELDERAVTDALEKAGAMAFISRLPAGIHTGLEEFGTNLSGGQRQRLALARALYKDPDVLFLDEATSSLDKRSEAEIQEALAPLVPDRITCIIAHRFSSLSLAQRIVLIQEGRVVAQGSHQSLLENCEEYRLLHRGDGKRPSSGPEPRVGNR